MKRAIVYLAWDENFIQLATTSAETAGIVGVDRLLITDAESRKYLKPEAPFERVIEHTFKLSGLLAKNGNVRRSPGRI
jgi:hypothetical protein